MSTCTKWVDQLVITCVDWANQVDHKCTSWADEGSKKCSQWADEGSNKCSQWADEGSKKCTAWEKCHWYTPWNCIAGFFCKAYYWVAKWVCKAYYWVAKWVCKAYYWVAKWVCKAYAWIVKAVCVVFSWALKLVCVAWDTLRCALRKLLQGILSLTRAKERRAAPKIEHVFVLMFENRSFDHMFGFSGITGVDVDGNPAVFNEGFDPMVNKNVDPTTGTDVPVSEGAEFFLKGVDKDPGHEFENTLTSLAGAGATYSPVPGGYPAINNSGFIENYQAAHTPARIMKCFSESNLPILNRLAREFAICDHWFSSLPGPTWPNRFFALAASSGGLDDSPSTLDIVGATTVNGYRFENGNIFDLLDDYCIDWKIFEGDEFPVSFALAGMNLNALQGRFKDFEDFATEVNKPDFSDQFIFIEPKYGAHGFDVTGPGDFACGNSMHPLDDVRRGELLVKHVYETIRNSPHWEKSMLLVMFDEHGGFYDHVAPKSAVPPGDLINTDYVKNHFQFDQLGVRVPALVISPYTPKNVIDNTEYDHTSMLATVERLFGMRNLTNRDKHANDLLHLLPLSTPRTDAPTSLPDVDHSQPPLSCEADDETLDMLLYTRSELRMAREKGVYKERKVSEIEMSPAQRGFLQVALLKVLMQLPSPDRQAWIEDYKVAQTGIDAAVFMTEAKLMLRHAIDLKKLTREGQQQAPAAGGTDTQDDRSKDRDDD